MSPPGLTTVFFDLGDTLVRSDGSWTAGARELLSDLKALGISLGVISNTGALSRPQILQLLPDDFDLALFKPALVLFSSEVGVEKPSPAIFEAALQRAGVEAERCLFCTESLIDALAAQRAGMIGARVSAPPASDLSQLLPALRAAHLMS